MSRPQRDQRFGAQAERPGKSVVLGAVADALGRQAKDRQRRIQGGEGGSEDGIADDGIGAQRQMRAMLLDRRHRQDGDGAGRIERPDIDGRQVFPDAHDHAQPEEVALFRQDAADASAAATGPPALRRIGAILAAGRDASHGQAASTSSGGLSSSGVAHNRRASSHRPSRGLEVTTANGIASTSPATTGNAQASA